MAWGKKPKQVASDQPAFEGLLMEAISIFVASMAHLESSWDVAKLEKKLREYLNKGAKHIVFRGKLPDLVNEYIDNALGSIFNALGDRDWLTQVDMLLLLDAGIKDNFPSILFRHVSQEEFETIVFAGYARAFDEQRFWPIITEACSTIKGPSIKKKVWTAIDNGRKQTLKSDAVTSEDFTIAWVTNAVAQLAMTSQGGPAASLQPDEFSTVFQNLLSAGGLPLSVAEEGAEPPLHLVEEIVQAAYAEHAIPEEDWGEAAPPPAKKMKGGWKGKGDSAWV